MPLSKAEAQAVTRLFVSDYPGALELSYKFRDNTAELYGPRAGEVPQGMKGGYVPKETPHADRMYRGRVEVPLENITDAHDLLLTLRHEVLGHYGISTFQPGEKRALLNGLIAAREEPSMKPLWDDIDHRYAGRPVDVRAEEVFALHCEGVTPSQHMGKQLRGQQAFQETCIASMRPMRAEDLQHIACMVAQGLHDRTRSPQLVPSTGHDPFRKGTDLADVEKTAEGRRGIPLGSPVFDPIGQKMNALEFASALRKLGDGAGTISLPLPHHHYAGKIIQFSDTHIVQKTGKQSAVAHDISKLANGAELLRQANADQLTSRWFEFHYAEKQGVAKPFQVQTVARTAVTAPTVTIHAPEIKKGQRSR